MLGSKCLIDYYLHNYWQQENENQITTTANLRGLQLTILHKEDYFYFFQEVNLGANNLANSLHRLHVLRECKKLSLSSNGIKSIARFPTLPKLQILSLRNNEISCIEEVLDLVKRHNLVQLDIQENPVGKFDVKSQIENISSTLQVKQ